jgi:hypothetical protein
MYVFFVSILASECWSSDFKKCPARELHREAAQSAHELAPPLWHHVHGRPAPPVEPGERSKGAPPSRVCNGRLLKHTGQRLRPPCVAARGCGCGGGACSTGVVRYAHVPRCPSSLSSTRQTANNVCCQGLPHVVVVVVAVVGARPGIHSPVTTIPVAAVHCDLLPPRCLVPHSVREWSRHGAIRTWVRIAPGPSGP